MMLGEAIISVFAPSFVLFGLVAQCAAQGTMQFRFEGRAPGTWITGSEYHESGMRFWIPYGPEGVALLGAGVSWAPDNGTGHLETSGGERLRFGFTNGMHFNLASFDLAEDRMIAVPFEVVGYKDMGVMVSQSFTTDGIMDGPGGQADFQTFQFDSRFVNVYQIDIITSRWALDNLVVSGVPEPTAGGLAALGAAIAACYSWMRKRRRCEGSGSGVPGRSVVRQ